jgi:hypothetical protein
MSDFMQWLLAAVGFFGALGSIIVWDALKSRRERKEREEKQS